MRNHVRKSVSYSEVAVANEVQRWRTIHSKRSSGSGSALPAKSSTACRPMSAGASPPNSRARFGKLSAGAAGDDYTAFSDLVGLGAKGAVPFGDIAWPKLVADFDDAVVPSQLHAAAELYFIYQHERMGVFRSPISCAASIATGACASSAARARAGSTSSRSGSRSATGRRTVWSPTCAPSATARLRGRLGRSSTSTSTTSSSH